MDRRTLFTVQAGLLLFLGAVLLLHSYAQSQKRRDRGVLWFSLGYLCAGVGLFFQSFRDIIPPFYSILCGNGIFMLFGAFCTRAIARTTHQKRDYFWLLLLLNLATLANYSYYTWWKPDVLLRTVEAVPVVSLMHLAAIDLLLRNKDKVIQPATRAMIACYILQIVPNVVRVVLELRLHVPDVWYSWSGIVTVAGLALGYLWIGSLRLHSELEHTAMTDPLTGLFNRRALTVLATREIQRAVRLGLPCSALMLDVDRFKQINDTLGHTTGDMALCAVAEALRLTLRNSDIPTRLGGDEFFVLLPDCDEEHVSSVTSRLRARFSGMRLKTSNGEEFLLSLSVGQVTLRGPQMAVEELLHAADVVLYQEKQRRERGDPYSDPSLSRLATAPHSLIPAGRRPLHTSETPHHA